MKTYNVIIYLYQQEKFVDFNSILFVCSEKEQETSIRSRLWRHMKKNKYTQINYNNKKLYSLKQILNDTELVSMMVRAEDLLAALKED